MLSRWACAIMGIAALVAACSSGSAGGPADGGAVEAAADGSDDGSSDDSSGSWLDDGGSGGPYPSADAPMFAADGCALLNVTCTNNAFCCSGWCNQGICQMQGHPAHDPPR